MLSENGKIPYLTADFRARCARVRSSSGRLGEAEAPTEPAGETLRTRCARDTDRGNKAETGASEVTGYAQAVSVTPPVRADLIKGGLRMAFGGSTVGVLQTLVVALGAGLIEGLLEIASDSLGGFMRS